MILISRFTSQRWGVVRVLRGTYVHAHGPLAIMLELEDGELLTNLSIYLYKPQCLHDSKDLPPRCFYVKEYGIQKDIAAEALASGLFKARDDLPRASSGFITAPVWELLEVAL